MDSVAGVGSLGFWFFIASVVVGNMWFDARKKESEQESLRRLVESGKDIDKEVLDEILIASRGESRADRDLKITGLIMLFIAPGLLVLGWFMAEIAEEMWPLMMGVAGLVVFVAVGCLVAGNIYQRWYRED